MIYLKGHLARPLDEVLSAPSRLAVLRELVRAKAPLSGRALARAAGINHQGAASALTALKRLGLVERRPAGRSDQWRLERRHWLVSQLLSPLFDRETAYAVELVAAIKAGLRVRASAAFIAGDAAKGRLEAGAAVELALVAAPSGRRLLAESLRTLAALMRARWGVALRVRVLTPREAARATAVENLWQLLPVEGPPSYFATGTTVQR